MERKTARTPKTAATAPKTAPKRTAAKTPAKGSTAAKNATPAKGAKRTPATPAKIAAKGAPKTAPRASGPTPDRIRLAGVVAKLRAKGTKWNEVAAETGKSEPTLAKLRKDVRAGVFANVSPASARVASDAF